MPSFWQMIEILCEQKGVTPEIMSLRLQIKKTTLYSWKRKGIIPRYETLVKLAEYFRVPREYFLKYKK